MGGIVGGIVAGMMGCIVGQTKFENRTRIERCFEASSTPPVLYAL
jgi:hypothetical protein